MGPKLKIHSFSAQSDAYKAFNAHNQVLCLDRTHLFLKDGIETQLSPSEYALCKLIFIGSTIQHFVPMTTLELCFRFFTSPTSLKRVESPLNQKTAPLRDESLQISDLDLFLFSHTMQLLPDRDLDPTWKQPFLLYLDDPDAAHLQKQQLLSSILTFRQDTSEDMRKRISKHVSGSNSKFNERGIGIQIFSVGQNKGYMASITSGGSVNQSL